VAKNGDSQVAIDKGSVQVCLYCDIPYLDVRNGVYLSDVRNLPTCAYAWAYGTQSLFGYQDSGVVHPGVWYEGSRRHLPSDR